MGDVFGFLCVLFFVVMLVAAWFVPDAKEPAKKAYLAALERLKDEPHNPDLREETLALGRKYVELVANASVFSELSLMNDINAACARAGSGVAAQPHGRPSRSPPNAKAPDDWFYARDGEQGGPVSLQQLKQFVTVGRLRGSDHVWREGMAEWVQAVTLPELFPTSSPAIIKPPPPPKRSA